MGSPGTPRDRFFATYDFAGLSIRWDVINRFDTSARILDVGAGFGKYRDLLPEYPHMDAVEIWWPNIATEHLAARYNSVIHADIADIEVDPYDVIIMGDVLEHIWRGEAKPLVARLADACEELYVAVPYEYPQGEVDDNPFEVHLQADLTDELVLAEYPDLVALAVSETKGVYVKRRTP